MASREPAGAAVITGASAGIGASYARRLAAAGHDLVLVARRADRLHRFAQELRGQYAVRAEPLVADLASDVGIDTVAERVSRDDVTLLVNNAGINGYAPLAHAEPRVLAAVVRINALAPVLLSRAAVAGMVARGHGAVINVASLLAFSGGVANAQLPRRATYAGTKAMIVAFTRALAAELADTNVRVQVVCPGYTATEFHLTNSADPVSEQKAGAAPPEPHAMGADDVAVASLLALQRGEVVCIPGLEDPVVFDELGAAEQRLMGAARSAQLADRYQAGDELRGT